MAKYSLNPDGTLKIVDDSSYGFVTFCKRIKRVFEFLSVIMVISSLIIYAVGYYNNDENEAIHSFFSGSDEGFIYCYNIDVTEKAINIEKHYIEELGDDLYLRIKIGTEWLIGRLSDFRKAVDF